MNTTKKRTFSGESGASDWLPNESGNRKGTYHWDKHDSNANVGDHAVEGDHLQIHNHDERVIRIFY